MSTTPKRGHRRAATAPSPSIGSHPARGGSDTDSDDNPTPSKRSKPSPEHTGPMITSAVIPRTHVPVDPLPSERRELYDLLRQYYLEISSTPVSKAGKARLASKQVKIIAAMALLHAPWDPKEWQGWYSKIGKRSIAKQFVDATGDMTKELVHAWLQHPPLSENRSNETRSMAARDAQKEVRSWYGKICILSGTNTTSSCHIIANSIERNQRSPFFDALEYFWSTERVANLMNLMKTPQYQLKNLLVLDNGVHVAWSEARFALKPLPAGLDPAEMRLEFHWLQPRHPGSVEHSRGPGMTNITDLRDNAPRRDLRTGDQIVLKTSDPSKYLLPDEQLLNLQYHLNRVVRASAAAENLELLFRDHEDPDPSGAETDLEEEDEFVGEEPVPLFIEFLIKSAIEQKIIKASDAEKWRRLLMIGDQDSDGEEDRGSDNIEAV